jgi:hypothetical protein
MSVSRFESNTASAAMAEKIETTLARLEAAKNDNRPLESGLKR